MIKRSLATLAILGCLLVAGCEFINPIGPIIQIGIYWLEGEAHKYYNTDEPTLRKATIEVLNELKLPIIKEKQYKDYYYIVAGDDDRFAIKIRPVRDNITKLSMRINTFGDKPFAEMIYRHVDAQPGVKQFMTVVELNTAMEERPRP